MSQSTHVPDPACGPRSVTRIDRGGLDLRSLVLLAALIAAGFILDFTIGKAIGALSGGAINPEFVIAAYCLTILVVRPGIGHALVIGLISAAIIQITTASPLVDFAAESVGAVVMALIVRAGMSSPVKWIIPAGGTFIATAASGVIFMLIKMAIMGFAQNIVLVMLPVVVATAVFNSVLAAALYLPIRFTLKLGDQ
ncbi:hypothetical protein Corgl_0734 [Coriobacterium glomerans PW2]|uniref:Uncharacterized protein n=1 Tax=Coriobacterium glomerans (strain ATCC 49209 / DSM 20642 / JCM 10262 / PW2) TaxID=700015 RepID=F2NBN9_CORGP|nr:hypothetical protein [Coriobacterium glomerans]AEB06848.1 hypothetical protein Corgl_0734 [Coriobacterium glomerans PW2]